MTIPELEAWMAKMVHYVYYHDQWFWYEYKDEFGQWPTPAMKARGIEMRVEYANREPKP